MLYTFINDRLRTHLLNHLWTFSLCIHCNTKLKKFTEYKYKKFRGFLKELSLWNKIKYLNLNIFRIRCCKPLIFQTQIIWSNKIHSLKYLRSATFGSKDIVIIKSEFVAKTQFLYRNWILYWRLIFEVFISHEPSWGHVRPHTKKLGPIGSDVLTFIGYKRTDNTKYINHYNQ